MERVAEAEQRQHGDTIDLTQPIRLMQRRQCCTGGGTGKAADVVDADDGDGQIADAAMRSPSSMSRHLFGQSRSSPKAPKTNYQLWVETESINTLVFVTFFSLVHFYGLSRGIHYIPAKLLIVEESPSTNQIYIEHSVVETIRD